MSTFSSGLLLPSNSYPTYSMNILLFVLMWLLVLMGSALHYLKGYTIIHMPLSSLASSELELGGVKLGAESCMDVAL